MTEWKSIRSAPKDGTEIDLLFPHPRGRTINCFWDKTFKNWTWRTPRWDKLKLLPKSKWDWHTYPNMKPTHWMTPPKLPKTTKQL